MQEALVFKQTYCKFAFLVHHVPTIIVIAMHSNSLLMKGFIGVVGVVKWVNAHRISLSYDISINCQKTNQIKLAYDSVTCCEVSITYIFPIDDPSN